MQALEKNTVLLGMSQYGSPGVLRKRFMIIFLKIKGLPESMTTRYGYVFAAAEYACTIGFRMQSSKLYEYKRPNVAKSTKRNRLNCAGM